MGEDQRRRFVAVTHIQLGCGPAGGELQLSREDQRRRVGSDLTEYAQVIAGVTFERRAGGMAVSRSSDLSGRIDVSLRNERVERDGQQHHAQQKCATRRSGEATCLCSLFPRQQLGNQRLNAVNGSCVIAHSRAEQNSHSEVPLQSANGAPGEQEQCNREPLPGASGPQTRVIEVARPLQCINHRVTPSLDFDAARSLIVTPSRCWTGRRRSFRPVRFSKHRHQQHERNLQQELQ